MHIEFSVSCGGMHLNCTILHPLVNIKFDLKKSVSDCVKLLLLGYSYVSIICIGIHVK